MNCYGLGAPMSPPPLTKRVCILIKFNDTKTREELKKMIHGKDDNV